MAGCKNLLNRDAQSEELNDDELEEYQKQEDALHRLVAVRYLKEHGWSKNQMNDSYMEYVKEKIDGPRPKPVKVENKAPRPRMNL